MLCKYWISLIYVKKYLLIFNLQNVSLVLCYLYPENIVYHSQFGRSWSSRNVFGHICLPCQGCHLCQHHMGCVSLVILFPKTNQPHCCLSKLAANFWGVSIASVLFRLLFAALLTIADSRDASASIKDKGMFQISCKYKIMLVRRHA